jgi:transposase
MSQPVRARRLHPDEGHYLLRLVRRGNHESIRVRRALIIMASASGTTVPAIARLVAADEDTVRDVIHAFNAHGLSCLDPHWAGGAPRRITDADTTLIVATATTRPRKRGLPFIHWSVRKLAAYLSGRYTRTDPAGHRPGWCASGGSDCARSCTPTASASSAPAPGRTPTTPTSRPNWTGSSR